MSDLNDSDNIETWVTLLPPSTDITISNLKKVTDKRYKIEKIIFPLVPDYEKSMFNVSYPQKLFLYNTFQKLYATVYCGKNIFLSLQEERFLSNYFGEPFIDAWLWKESYLDVFEIIPATRLNMTLYWMDTLYVDEESKDMLICKKREYIPKIIKLYNKREG
jgi:hypothetical protein